MENVLEKIEKKDLRELLSKGWITHDAMWLYHVIQECGIEKAAKINVAAVDSMSVIEIRRIQKALGYGKDPITDFDALFRLMTEAFGIIKADFMKFEFNAPEKNVCEWKWADGKCFAFEGVSGLGAIDGYKCGIIKRIEGWLNGLGVEYRMEPSINECLMKNDGKCRGRFVFDLN